MDPCFKVENMIIFQDEYDERYDEYDGYDEDQYLGEGLNQDTDKGKARRLLFQPEIRSTFTIEFFKGQMKREFSGWNINFYLVRNKGLNRTCIFSI